MSPLRRIITGVFTLGFGLAWAQAPPADAGYLLRGGTVHTVSGPVIENGSVLIRDGKIVGEATLYRALHGWTVHVAELRVAVAPPMRRNGLGTALARELVRLATRTGIEKMIIQVVENQVGARKMFRKLGFRQEAVLRGHVKDIHGMKRDLIVGANDVSHIWDAMESLVADFSPSVE